MNVRTASQTFLFNQAKQNDIRTSFAMIHAIELLSNVLLFGNKMLTRASAKKVKANKCIIAEIAKITPKLFSISKQGDMQEKKARKGNIHLKNGKVLKLNLIIVVPTVAKRNCLPKTTLSQFLRAVRTTSIIFNPFAVVAIVANGYFDIHQHPELLEAH